MSSDIVCSRIHESIMENNNVPRYNTSKVVESSCEEELPKLIKAVLENKLAHFDNFNDANHLCTAFRFFLSSNSASGTAENGDIDRSKPQPSSPKPVMIEVLNKQGSFHPQQMECCSETVVSTEKSANPGLVKLNDNRFDSFKTFSGKFERQESNLRGNTNRETGEQILHEDLLQSSEADSTLPVDRYFDALEGPDLDTLKASEEIILPKDKKWPFLLRFPISSFGMCLGISSQAIMWKSLSSSESTKFLHITAKINLVIWLVSLVLVLIVFVTYTLKILFYFEAVRREYYHPIRINFFFAPWIVFLFLALGVPPSITKTLNGFLWYVLMTPIFLLELKIYGQWMSGGQRRLSKVANPSNHLAVVGNFVGALLGASMGLREGPIFFFAVGLAHYIVLFVTLYQRLPTNETLPKDLHPVFFLFVATPSVASMAWARIDGSFDFGSRIAYFVALFLYFSLAIRINFFRGFRFSLAWWAYTFPMTSAAIATIRYSDAVPSVVTKSLSVLLCVIATLTVLALLVTTIVHAFVLRDLFPNDNAIAISERRPQKSKKWHQMGTECSDGKDIEHGIYHHQSQQPISTSVQELSDSCNNKDVQVSS